jgi:prepilin-type N-terminal cleavage/methylation domain-containing protein
MIGAIYCNSKEMPRMTRTPHKKTPREQEKGFTLVELAIVIVIIGLIVGGILAGQDLIRAATIRATLSDLDRYNAGATTFLNKYGGLPGDLLATNATQFGFTTSTLRTGARGLGDGNGLLEGCSAGATALGCETGLFWTDLSVAGLIPQDVSGIATGVATTVDNETSIAIMSTYLPSQRIRQGTFQHVYATAGRNRFALGSFETGAAGAINALGGVTPGEARSMDEKLDDALPGSGVVIAVATGTGTLGTADAGGGTGPAECITGTAAADDRVYNVVEDAIDNINCVVQFRASF